MKLITAIHFEKKKIRNPLQFSLHNTEDSVDIITVKTHV